MTFSPDASDVYRTHVTKFVPSSGYNEPSLDEIRALLAQYEAVMNAFTTSGGLIYQTMAAMNAAATTFTEPRSAWQFEAGSEGIYALNPTTDTWTKVGRLPYDFVIGTDTGAGTANAIQITTDIPVADGMIVAFTLFEATTASPVTISINGGAALTLKTNRGSNASALTADMEIWGRYRASDSTLRLLNDQDVSALVAQAEAARDDAVAAALYVAGVETLAAAEASSPSDSVKYLQLLGRGAYGDGGAFKAIEVTEDGSPLGPGQFKTNVNLKRWENAEDIITPAMFADITEMFAFTEAQMRIPSGNYEFGAAITVRDNAVIRCENGAAFIPTFEPIGVDRETPMIDLGSGCDINYIKLQLDAGINTIQRGIRFGDYAKVGFAEAVSSDLNNNRTGTENLAGAFIVDGEHIRIGGWYVNRFDSECTFVDCSDVIVGKTRAVEIIRGVFGYGNRDVHVLSGHHEGPVDPNEPNAFGRGIMTPGANSLVLAGFSDSSFGLGGGWYSYDILEHAIRLGQVLAGSTVPNHRIAIGPVFSFRPYGCGFKCDDADDFNIKRVTVESIYTEDVGNGNWFGTVGYENWQSGGVNNPALDNDGNKVACAIRNSQFVQIGKFMNRANLQAESGQIGFWVERSNNVTAHVDTEKSRTIGVLVQSGGTTATENVVIRGRTSDNIGTGVKLDASNSNAAWRGNDVEVNSQNNGGYDFEATANLSGGTPYATRATRLAGFARGGSSGTRSIAAIVAADADFVVDIKERGTFTPTAAFATPGTSSWAYSSQVGRYWVDGDRCFVEIELTATPTKGTASGTFRVLGLPFPAASSTNNIDVVLTDANLSSWNSRTVLVPSAISGASYIEIRGLAAAASSSPLGVSNFTDAAAHSIRMSGWYRI